MTMEQNEVFTMSHTYSVHHEFTCTCFTNSARARKWLEFWVMNPDGIYTHEMGFLFLSNLWTRCPYSCQKNIL